MKPRKAPFSVYEKELLKELIAPHITVIESKKTDSDFNKKKLLLWIQITKDFNNSPRCQEATTQQLKKLWLNMKAKARDAKSLEQQRKHTGGGPSIPDMTPENESVCAMIPHIMPTINVSLDSDGLGDEINGDDDDMYWQPKRARKKSPSPEFLPEANQINQLLASSSFRESTAAEVLPEVNQYPTSINEARFKKKTVTKNEITIDMLKIQLIQRDIENRETKFKIEIDNQKIINDLKYQMLVEEFAHKKRMHKLIEKEQEEKLKKVCL